MVTEIRDLQPEPLRKVLGQFATGVCIVTCGTSPEDRRAITVSSFTSVSLDPPLVLFCLDKSAFHLDRFLASEHYAISLLAQEQVEISNRFARETQDAYADLPTTILSTGCSALSGSLASLDCDRESVHEAGDHHIIISRVVALHDTDVADPLIYFGGGYARLTR